MDLEVTIQSQPSPAEKDMWYHLHEKSKKIIQINSFTGQKQTHRHRKQTYGYQRVKARRRDKLGLWY